MQWRSQEFVLGSGVMAGSHRKLGVWGQIPQPTEARGFEKEEAIFAIFQLK